MYTQPQISFVYVGFGLDFFLCTLYTTFRIPNHKQKMKQNGTGQSWFPKNWTSRDIKHAGEHVANLKGNRHVHLNDGKPLKCIQFYRNLQGCILESKSAVKGIRIPSIALFFYIKQIYITAYIRSCAFLAMTSNCCSLVRSMNLTA